MADVIRDEIERLEKELMVGEKSKVMKQRAVVWKNLAEKATNPDGSSYKNFYEKIVGVVLLSNSNHAQEPSAFNYPNPLENVVPSSHECFSRCVSSANEICLVSR